MQRSVVHAACRHCAEDGFGLRDAPDAQGGDATTRRNSLPRFCDHLLSWSLYRASTARGTRNDRGLISMVRSRTQTLQPVLRATLFVCVSALLLTFARQSMAQDRASLVRQASESAQEITEAAHTIAQHGATFVPTVVLDEDVRLLLAIQIYRRDKLTRAAERTWNTAVERIAHRALLADDALDLQLVAALSELAPGAPQTAELRRVENRANIQLLLASGDVDAGVSAAFRGARARNARDADHELLAEARRARMNYILDDPSAHPARVLMAWRDALALLESGSDDLPFARIVDRFFAAARTHANIDHVEEFVRVVARLNAQAPSRETELMLAGTHYSAAALYWEMHGAMISGVGARLMDHHLSRADELGYQEDPFSLRRRRFWSRAAPALMPAMIFFCLGLAGLWYSRPRRRWSGRRWLRRARRLHSSGEALEAAAAYLQAYRVTEGLAILTPNDQRVIATSLIALMNDALRRGRLGDATQWADRLADLPHEYWPRDFPDVARRCGVDLRAEP